MPISADISNKIIKCEYVSVKNVNTVSDLITSVPLDNCVDFTKLELFMQSIHKLKLIIKGHNKIQSKNNVDDSKSIKINTFVYAKSDDPSVDNPSVLSFNSETSKIPQKIIPTTYSTEKGLNQGKEDVTIDNKLVLLKNSTSYKPTAKIFFNKRSDVFYPVISTSSSNELVYDSFIIVNYANTHSIDGIHPMNKTKINDSMMRSKILGNIMFNRSILPSSVNNMCYNCFIRTYDDANDLLPINFQKKTRNDHIFTSNDYYNDKINLTTIKTAINNTIHCKELKSGHNTKTSTPVDLLNPGNISPDKSEYWKNNFGHALYTTPILALAHGNKIFNHVNDSPSVIIKLRLLRDDFKTIFISSPNMIEGVPFLTQEEYNKAVNAGKSTEISQFIDQLNDHFDAIIISNFAGWGDNTRVKPYGSNADSLQINITRRAFKRAAVTIESIIHLRNGTNGAYNDLENYNFSLYNQKISIKDVILERTKNEITKIHKENSFKQYMDTIKKINKLDINGYKVKASIDPSDAPKPWDPFNPDYSEGNEIYANNDPLLRTSSFIDELLNKTEDFNDKQMNAFATKIFNHVNVNISIPAIKKQFEDIRLSWISGHYIYFGIHFGKLTLPNKFTRASLNAMKSATQDGLSSVYKSTLRADLRWYLKTKILTYLIEQTKYPYEMRCYRGEKDRVTRYPSMYDNKIKVKNFENNLKSKLNTDSQESFSKLAYAHYRDKKKLTGKEKAAFSSLDFGNKVDDIINRQSYDKIEETTHVVGNISTLPHLTSFSFYLLSVGLFVADYHCCINSIFIPKGFPCRYVNGLGQEKEVLLSPCTKLKEIRRVENFNNKKGRLYVEYIAEDYDLIYAMYGDENEQFNQFIMDFMEFYKMESNSFYHPNYVHYIDEMIKYMDNNKCHLKRFRKMD